MDATQIEERDYYLYLTFDHDDTPMDAIIIKKIGPDLHVNIETIQTKLVHWTLRITYTLSGKELCILQITPNLPHIKDELKVYTSITNQQQVHTYLDSAMQDILYATSATNETDYN